ncbi:MAG: RelA/SpoT domain-containing protein [Synergistaceae bacterium]|nr:RelA/SpoT domain-containing protein [Synergistaceae bacterium]
MISKRRIDEIGIKYVESLKLYEEYAARIRNLIQDLVEVEGVEFYAIEGWAEPPAELLNMLQTLDEKDLAGVDLVTVRVLLRFPADVLKIEELVRNEFDVDPSRSLPSNSGALRDPRRFGYPAVVYILSLSESRSTLKEWAKYKDLSFRLELRTMLQEVWATILPKVNQTVGTASEEEFTRELFLLGAMLEKADKGFLTLRDEIKEEALLVPPSLDGRKKPEIPEAETLFTDEELYRLFRDDPSILSRWNKAAIDAGFPEFTPDAEYLRGSFSYLCNIFRAAGIDTIQEVRKFLADMENDDKGLRQLKTLHDTFKDNGKWRVDPFSALFLLALNFRWDNLKDKDLVKLNIKKGSDRISGMD